MVGDSGAEAGIGLEELVHPVGVAGQDDHQVVALVLHDLEQDLDRLLPVVAFVIRAIEVIGLVDEQHPAHRLLQDLLRLGRGVADVLTDKIISCHRDQMPFAHIAEPEQDVRHPHCDGGLTGSRVTGEAHVKSRCRLCQT